MVDKYKLTGNPVLYTFNVQGTVNEGDAVTLVGNETVGRGADGAPFFGVVHFVQGNKATVQVAGTMVVRYTGTVTAGAGQRWVVDGTGVAKVSATSGTFADAVFVDSSSGQAVLLK